MGLLIVLIITEIFTPVVLRQHFYADSKAKYTISIVIHVILSLWVWILFIETTSYNSFFDNPRHVWLMLNLTGIVIAVVLPRIILNILHFSGKLIRIKNGGHLRWLTNTGLIIMLIILAIISIGSLYGRFNFKTEEVTINIKGLNKDLDGLKIIQLSDMHLTTFYHHKKILEQVMNEVNTIKPDLILNTGDFVSYGWREFERYDTILNKARSKYGNYAILGNHDAGTYDPFFTEADKENNILIMNKLIEASGYQVLDDEFKIVNIGKARIALVGVITKGRHPHMIHGNLDKAISGLDSVDLKILLTHDPNHWAEAVTGKTDIGITLSGHTHGMQMGIITKKFRWSPAKYFYPHWNGLYKTGNQYQYVNRGLGVLAIPFRIWMPPEITILTIKSE
ncbi:MAG TPA: metallophosphoesterase [Bacteroidales bacterium]